MGLLERLRVWIIARARNVWDAADRGITTAWDWCRELAWQRLEPNTDPTAVDGTALLISLATFAITQAGALGFVASYVHSKWTLLRFLIGFALLACLGIIVLLRLPAEQIAGNPNRPYRHYYDRGTIAIGYWSLLIALVVPLTVVYIVNANLFGSKVRQPFESATIECEELVPDSRPGKANYVSLLGAPIASRDAKEGNRILGDWLAAGADVLIGRPNADAILSDFDQIVAPFRQIKDDAGILDKVKKMVDDFDTKYGSLLTRNAKEGLYVVRQKFPFTDDFQQLECTLEITGATEELQPNGGVDRVAFLCHSDEDGYIVLRQVYFTFDPKIVGLTKKLRFTPNKDEQLIVLTYLKGVQKRPHAELKVSKILD